MAGAAEQWSQLLRKAKESSSVKVFRKMLDRQFSVVV